MTPAFKDYVRQSIDVMEGCLSSTIQTALEQSVDMLHRAIVSRRPILICGNGGSASDAEHFAAELVCRYKKNREAFNVMALSNSGALATAISNDFGYASIFSRQVEAYAQKDGVFIGITTSGTSPNVLKAFTTAKNHQMQTIALTGAHTEDLSPNSDIILSIPSKDTPLIQQAHLLCYHFICDQLERRCSP